MDAQQPQPLRLELGPVEIDWAKTLGYYGGIAAAVAYGMIEWPLGLFIAGMPFYKMLQHPKASVPVQAVSDLLDGAGQPVGGSADGVIKLRAAKGMPGVVGSLFGRVADEARGMWNDARKVAS